MRTVFISYSHKDEAWKDKLLPQLKSLEQAGVDMKVWEDRQIDAGAKWYPEIINAMTDAAVAILLISADYLASGFCIKEEVPFLIQRQEQHGMLLIPVLLRNCPWKTHRWLADRQMLPRDGKCIAINFPGDQADIIFNDVAEKVFDHFGRLASRKPTIPEIVGNDPRKRSAFLPSQAPPMRPVAILATDILPPDRIDLTRLPETGSALFGRDGELEFLDHVWDDVSESRTRVLAFTAHGGVGKSTLINHWLAEMKHNHFRGATRVFGWSFYSQGVREQGPASADIFIAEALKFFGDQAMAKSPASPWEKGERLAHLLGTERALLVLDGIEPLQSAHAFDRGKLSDPALESLLRGLAKKSTGLCLITSREPLTDFLKRPHVSKRDLEQITPQAGRALLRTARVIGTDAELEDLAKRFGPHALAISLLGVYLHEQPGHGIGPAKQLEELHGSKPVDRVLAGFENLLGNSAELEALSLLGFFDRPANPSCLKALRQKPPILELNTHLIRLARADWNDLLGRLERLRIISVRKSHSGQSFVDTHPLIREHFASRLYRRDINAWHEGHRRLCSHLCTTTSDKDQPTLEDLQPFYAAIAHGCLAGMPQEAFEHIYYKHISRGKESYTVKKLGAIGSELAAMSCFFEKRWSKIYSSVAEICWSSIYSITSYCLRSQGRLTDALEPTRISVDVCNRIKDWTGSTSCSGNLAELELTLGDISQALRHSTEAITSSNKSIDVFDPIRQRGKQANILHESGNRRDAQAIFEQIEKRQFEEHPTYNFLYSLQGFYYCTLLLASAEIAAWQITCNIRSLSEAESAPLKRLLQSVSQRARKTLEWSEENRMSILNTALDRLTLARVALYEAIFGFTPFETCVPMLHQVMDGFRHAGTQHWLPSILLARAWFYKHTEIRPIFSAIEDLDDAWEIAETASMKLHMADIHLYRARLFFREAKYPWTSPAADLAAAERLINECGYHRRDEELAAAKNAILGN